MNSTYNTGAIAQGFGALAQALAPNYQGMIQADLARYQRDGMIADANYRNALTGKTGLESDRLRADNAALAAGRAAINAGIVNPDGTLNPNNIAAIFAGNMGNGAAMTATPGFVTGLRTSVDPNFVNDPSFSGVLTGTGVQAFPNTPAGQAASLANTLAGDRIKAESAANVAGINADSAANVAGINGQTSRDVATINGVTNRDVASINGVTNRDVAGIGNQGRFELQKDAQTFALTHPGVYLNGANGSKPTVYATTPLDMKRIMDDPSTNAMLDAVAKGKLSATSKQAVIAKAAELYSSLGNWPLALQRALASFTYKEGEVDAPGLGTGNYYEATPAEAQNPLTNTLSGADPSTAAGTAAANAVAPAAGGGTPAPNAPVVARADLPAGAAIKTNPATGKSYSIINGKLVEVQ